MVVRVLKFGGSSLGDAEAVRRVARIVATLLDGEPEAAGTKSPERPVLVVSAHEGVTSLLDRAAREAAAGNADAREIRLRHRSLLAQLGLTSELVDRYLVELRALLQEIARRGRLEPGELDYVLSYGERMSARIVAASLREAGIAATPVDAFDAGLVTDGRSGGARPLTGIAEPMRRALGEIEGVPVVTGFLARDRAGRLTTLGPNGSDWTATLVAEALSAAEVRLYKPVAGLLDADPRLVEDARPIEAIDYGSAAEFAYYGADVLHPSTVAPLQRAGIPLRILHHGDPRVPGTIVDASEKPGIVLGVATRRDVVELRVPLPDAEGRSHALAEFFGALDRIGVEGLLVSSARDHLAVVERDGPELRALAEELSLELREGFAVVALVGRRIGDEVPITLEALAALGEAGCAVRSSFQSQRSDSQAFLVDDEALERAARALHRRFRD